MLLVVTLGDVPPNTKPVDEADGPVLKLILPKFGTAPNPEPGFTGRIVGDVD